MSKVKREIVPLPDRPDYVKIVESWPDLDWDETKLGPKPESDPI